MTVTSVGTNRFQVLVESVCRSLDQGKMPQTEDFRQLFTQLQQNLQHVLPGGQWLTPGGVKSSGSASPSGLTFSVAGQNGSFSGTVSGGAAQGRTVWYEFSYSTLRSFTQNVTTLPASASPSFTQNLPDQSLFWRMRASYDQVNWSNYVFASQAAISSGLVSSAATSNAGAFNQTNYGVVTSAAVGPTAEVSVQGANGPFTSMVAQKGPTQSVLPGATVVGVTPGSDLFVGYTGQKYVLRYTLADLLADDTVTPIGKVSVVETGVPTLPTVALVLGAGGAVIAWNVLTQGNGLTAPVTLTIVTATGSGATPGAQTIQNGKLISIAPGNPGTLYAGGDTVLVTGGVGAGTPGGGTALGGNGGRLTAV
jgi:hypothetical protein